MFHKEPQNATQRRQSTQSSSGNRFPYIRNRKKQSDPVIIVHKQFASMVSETNLLTIQFVKQIIRCTWAYAEDGLCYKTKMQSNHRPYGKRTASCDVKKEVVVE